MNSTGVALLFLMICGSILIPVFKPFSYWRSASISLAAISLFAMLYLGWFEWQYIKGFSQIQKADTRKQVMKIMGTPKQTTSCQNKRFEHANQQLPFPSCVLYRSFFFPSVWQFTFNEENRLIKKYHLVSP